MKKIMLRFSAVVVFVLLTACQSTTKPTDAEQDKELKATLTIEFGDKTDSKEVTFEKGDSVMDILEENHDIKEDEGMVTAIDGMSQDLEANVYWLYNVNDELASKGAEDMKVSEGDTITFYLQAFE